MSILNKRLSYVAAVVAAQLTASAMAQNGTTPTTAPTTAPTRQLTGVRQNGATLTLNFQDATIDVILDELSAAAGFIVVKEVRPEGRVTLVSKQPVSKDEAVALLNTVMRNAGYAAIQQDRVLKIVNKDVAKRLNIPVRSGNDPLKIANSDELITQVIPLRFADATQLKNDLQPLVNTDADFTANASANSLVITDTSANVKRVVEIVAALDTNLADAVNVKVFQLKFASAANAARLLNEVFGNLDATRPQQNSGGDSAQGGGRGQGGGQGGGGGPGGGFQRFLQQQAGGSNRSGGGRSGKISAAADERTNSVVVTGPSDLLETVAEVIKGLDSNPIADETVYVYRLRNAQAVNVEQVLNALFNGTSISRSSTSSGGTSSLRSNRTGTTGGTGNTRSSTGGGRTTGGGTNTGTGGFGTNAGSRFGGNTGTGTGAFGGFGGFGGTGGNTRVSANSQQTASDLAGQVSIIADTDTNSLLIRTAPGNYDRVKEVLADLDKPVQQVLIKVLIAEVTHNNGHDFGVELSAINLGRGVDADGNPKQSGSTNFNIPTVGANATGLVVQIIESNFAATIRALETAGKLDVLSRPYILASDNQLASITVGQEVPLIDSSRITDTGQTINTLRYEDVGILLDVIPHINQDGLVILDVAPEISTLTSQTVPISDTASAPVIAKRSAESRVGVYNGQTIVIGGLMEDRVTESVSKVPFLGDIPIVGEAFKRTIKNKAKTELLIFLTPHVVADPAKLNDMSKDEVKGTKLVPGAVAPGTYDEHQEGMLRGDAINPVSKPPEEPAPAKP